MRVALVPITLTQAVQRPVTVAWATMDLPADDAVGYGAAVAGQDYIASSGNTTFPPGHMAGINVHVRIRPDDSARRRSRFAMTLTARNGAVVPMPHSMTTLPGWVGLLDQIGIVDGTAAPFVAGSVGVSNG